MRWELLEGKEQLFCENPGCGCLVISVHLLIFNIIVSLVNTIYPYVNMLPFLICQLISQKHTLGFILTHSKLLCVFVSDGVWDQWPIHGGFPATLPLFWLGNEADDRKMDGWILLISIWIFRLESESELFLKKQLNYTSYSARSAITFTIYSSIFFLRTLSCAAKVIYYCKHGNVSIIDTASLTWAGLWPLQPPTKARYS